MSIDTDKYYSKRDIFIRYLSSTVKTVLGKIINNNQTKDRELNDLITSLQGDLLYKNKLNTLIVNGMNDIDILFASQSSSSNVFDNVLLLMYVTEKILIGIVYVAFPRDNIVSDDLTISSINNFIHLTPVQKDVVDKGFNILKYLMDKLNTMSKEDDLDSDYLNSERRRLRERINAEQFRTVDLMDPATRNAVRDISQLQQRRQQQIRLSDEILGEGDLQENWD